MMHCSVQSVVSAVVQYRDDAMIMMTIMMLVGDVSDGDDV